MSVVLSQCQKLGLVRLGIRGFASDGPAFLLRRSPYKYSRLFEANEYRPPSSFLCLYENVFLHATPEEHQRRASLGSPLPVVHNLDELVPTSLDASLQFEWCWRYIFMYGCQREPVYPRPPDLSRHELVAGASVTRTQVWNNNNEPAIQAVKKFHPDYFRPAGFSETAPNPTSCTPEGLPDFREYRLQPGHADRRPFMYLMSATSAMIMAGIGRAVIVKFLQYLYISRDYESFGAIEVDTSKMAKGENLTMKWRGKPVFIFRRTPEQITASQQEDRDVKTMKDPATDSERCPNPEWLVCMGACTHLGCIPIFGEGHYNGYFCPCHGSHYDLAGRIRAGPAPLNLPLPEYQWVDNAVLRIG